MADKAKPERKPRAKATGRVLSGVPRVNLLPPSEVERRAAAGLARRWAGGLVATALVVSGAVGAAHWVRNSASMELEAERDRTLTLNSELASFSHVSKALADRAALTTMRGEAMGNDTEWRALFKDVTTTIPGGARLEGFAAIPGANPVAGPGRLEGVGAIALLTVWSDDATDQNRMIDNLRKLDQTIWADAGAINADGEDDFTFIVELVVDQSYYSGDFGQEGGAR